MGEMSLVKAVASSVLIKALKAGLPAEQQWTEGLSSHHFMEGRVRPFNQSQICWQPLFCIYSGLYFCGEKFKREEICIKTEVYLKHKHYRLTHLIDNYSYYF